MGRRYGYPAGPATRKVIGMMRIFGLLIALALTAGCSYIQMQPKGGAQATPYAPRLP